jgi:zinc D-Ala-D-Ala dipeptidase
MAGGNDRLILPRRVIISGVLLAPLATCTQSINRRIIAKQERSSLPPPESGVELVELVKLDPTIRLDLRYATANNFTGRALYSAPRAFLQADAAAALVRAHVRAKGDGFGLTIFDAYRPWRVTKKLWDETPRKQRNYVANPKKGSRHNRGCAVDLTLHDLGHGQTVEMPSAFDDFSERAHRDYGGASAAATANRTRLATYLEAENFEGLSNEWWHFDYRDWSKHPILDIPFERL